MTYTWTRHPFNRLTFPTRWILLVEDNIEWQIQFLSKLREKYGQEGDVLIVAAPSGVFAAAAILAVNALPICALVDMDMPWGNGAEFTQWLVKTASVPIIAISGIPANNEGLVMLGAKGIARKGDWEALDECLNRLT